MLNRHTFRPDQLKYVNKNDLQHSQMTQALTKISSYSSYHTVSIHNFYAILEEGYTVSSFPKADFFVIFSKYVILYNLVNDCTSYFFL